MITLTVGNSEAKIEGLDRRQLSVLKKILSYRLSPQEAFFSKARYQTRCLLDKRGGFPTGLLGYVKKFLAKEEQPITTVDTRSVPEPRQSFPVASLPMTPYPEQTNAALACLNAHRGIVVAPTGSGKSIIIALIINQLKVPTLVVVPTLELKRQITETLSLIFMSQNVGTICDKRLITVENVDALKTNKPLVGYDCVIIDEFHHSAASTYRKLNKNCWKEVYHKFGCTATPFRSQYNEKILLESVLAEVIYTISYDTAVDRGFVVPLEAYYMPIAAPRVLRSHDTYAGAYSDLIVNNEARNAEIARLLIQLNESKISCLCLVKEIKHGDLLVELTGLPFANGLNEDTRYLIQLFNERKVDVLIGTMGVLGEGVDSKPCEYVILASPVKSKNLFMQCVGRAFRRFEGKESAKLVTFKDFSHKWFMSAFKAQCKILLDEYGVKIVEL